MEKVLGPDIKEVERLAGMTKEEPAKERAKESAKERTKATEE